MGILDLQLTRSVQLLDDWILQRKRIEDSSGNLRGADLSHAKLMKADLRKADLRGADLSFSYLMRADLTGANLEGVDLSDSVIIEANLSEANLEDADLTDAYLHGTDLRRVRNLTADQIESAFIDRDTLVPEYLQVVWTSEKTFTCAEKT